MDQDLYILHAKDWDFPFVRNDNTESFFDEDGVFPIFDPDIDGLYRYIKDSIDNARWFGDWNRDDDNWYIGFKNGKVDYLGDGRDIEGIRMNVYAPKNLNWLVWFNSAEVRFWVRDFDALLAMNEEFGWFDIDLYFDWI